MVEGDVPCETLGPSKAHQLLSLILLSHPYHFQTHPIDPWQKSAWGRTQKSRVIPQRVKHTLEGSPSSPLLPHRSYLTHVSQGLCP